MSVKIVKVSSRSQLKTFIRFPYGLYKNEENWCPALEGDEFDTFNPSKNGAYRFCQADCFLAYKDGKPVGRVAAIINERSNEKDGIKAARFGWFDAVEDQEVFDSLIATVEEWGRERGCTSLKGPLGFTDMDKEGLLVEGYDKMCPFTCLYNFPYYDEMLKKTGLEKDCDWIQRKIDLTVGPLPIYSFADQIGERFHLHMAKVKNTRELAKKYGMAIFHMYNESFAPLYGTTPLDDDQIRNYLATYVPILDKDYTAVCLDENDNPVGFAFCVPSLAKAVRKSMGKLFPLGLFRVLRALKHNDTMEALMIGVKPEYQAKGVSLLLVKFVHENCLRNGIKSMLLNPQLEDNIKALTMFDMYNPEFYMRRRCYTKSL